MLVLILIAQVSFAQDSTRVKYPQPSVSKKALELEESLENKNDKKTAEKYEELALALISENNFPKAEEYLNKALQIYQDKKNNKKIAEVKRLLAQIQEKQDKVDDAIHNYRMAGEVSPEPAVSQANRNDASRLSQSNPEVQNMYLDSNLSIWSKAGKTEEAAITLTQKAEIQLKSDNKEQAIINYVEALRYSSGNPESVIRIKSEIAKVYEADNQLQKAIEVTTAALKEAVDLNLVSEQIRQSKSLATLLFKKNDEDEAVRLLDNAYQTALSYGRTFEAKEMAQLLSEFYKSKGEMDKSLEFNSRFMNDLERLIKSDSTLIDAKIFQVTEGRIKQLEEEKLLKDELIASTNKLNYVLIGSVALMLLLLTFIIKAFYSIKNRNKKIALQSLRREMNPHFIFNSLNSVNQFIAQNNEREANNYLTSYSNLMRNMMETSNQDFIPVSEEIEQIEKYLKLEHLRFSDKFDYEIFVDPEIDADTVLIPNMLIQPNLENAIWHGLRYREGKGLLKISLLNNSNAIKVRIEDNGIGYKKSMELKTENQKLHESRGLSNVQERIKLLNDLYRQKISFSMSEGTAESGTLVEIFITKTRKVWSRSKV